MNRTRKTFFIVALVVIAGMFLVRIRLPRQSFSLPPDAATVTIVVGEDARRFAGSVIVDMTVADALQLAGRAGRFDVVFDDRGHIVRLDNWPGPWRAERNGDVIGGSIAEEPVRAGDEVLIVGEASSPADD